MVGRTFRALMSESLFRRVSKLARTPSITPMVWVLACACQSTSTEPSATTAESTTAFTAPAVTATTQSPPTAETAPNPVVSALETSPEAASTVAPVEAKPGSQAAANPKPAKGAEAAKTDPTKAPEPTPDPPKPEQPVIEKPCLATSFKFAAVRSACEKGGVPKAKALMKAWTNKAKEKGESYKCATCHDNQKTYTNKPSADADLRKLLDVIK